MNQSKMDNRNMLSPIECMQHIQQAISNRDLEALTQCFEPDYASEFPAHPDRAFTGHAQMRKNWSQIFGAVPNIQATLIHCTADGDMVWAEWEWKGVRLDGAPFVMRGVTVQGVPHGRIKWARLYVEPVDSAGAGTDAAVRQGTIGSKADGQ